MTVQSIKELLNARVLGGSEMLDREVYSACGSDMMSDVLAHVDDQAVLITGLCNPQVLRTAEMMDIVCVIMVRNKEPDEAMIQMAQERNICLLATSLPMFTSCGLLYKAGLRGGAHHGE
jgi:predicted transcriptional regulator